MRSSSAGLLVVAALCVAACGGPSASSGKRFAQLRPQCTGGTFWDGKTCAARADTKAEMKKAQDAMGQLKLEVALPIFQRLAKSGPYAHADYVAIYEQLGIALAYAERMPEASDAFTMVLNLSPNHLLSYGLNSGVTYRFGVARADVAKTGTTTLHVRWPSNQRVSKPVPVDVEVVADPKSLLHRAELNVRRRGSGTYRSVDLALPSVGKVRRVRIPALGLARPEVLQFYVSAFDKKGNEVLLWGSPSAPREIPLGYTPVTPWYRKWWVWASIGGAVAATTGAGVYLLTREPSDTVGGDFGFR